MKFIEIEEGTTIGELTMNGNTMVADDISKIEAFMKVGKNVEITKFSAERNEVHNPDSYANKVKNQREELFDQIKEVRYCIESITDNLAKQKIISALREAEAQPLSQEGEWRVKIILGGVLKISKDIGAAVLASVIASYLGV